MDGRILEENAKFRVIVSSITECIKSVDKNYCLVDMNATGLSLIGANCLLDVKGKSLQDLILPEYWDGFKKGVDKVFKGEVIDQEFEIISLDGTKRWMHQIAVPYYNPQQPSEILEMVAVTRDVTVKKKQDATLAQMSRNELLNMISAGVAHDFNNILGVIAGNAELLSLRNHQETLAQPIDRINKSVKRARNLTNKLLKFSKGYQGESIQASIGEVCLELQEFAKEITPSNIKTLWNIEDNLSLTVSKHDFEDILLNFIINAINAIDEYGTIQINARKVERMGRNDYFVLEPSDSKEYVLLEVVDNGKGIPPDLIDDIFLPFKSFSKKKGGSGLGLATIYSYLGTKKFGLSVNSLVGEGSAFRVWIPYSTKILDDSISGTDELGQFDTLDSLDIVLVDDEIELLDTTASLLKLKGHQVTAFSDASQAIDFLDVNRHKIDLVITDETMPGDVQGHNLLSRYRNDIPMVLITGYADNDNIKDYEEHVVRKPFSMNELLYKATQIIRKIQ